MRTKETCALDGCRGCGTCMPGAVGSMPAWGAYGVGHSTPAWLADHHAQATQEANLRALRAAAPLTADTITDEEIRALVCLVTNAYVSALGRRRRARVALVVRQASAAPQPAKTIAVVYSRGTDDSPRGFRAVVRDSLWLDDGEEVAGYVNVEPDTRDSDVHARCAEILNARRAAERK